MPVAAFKRLKEEERRKGADRAVGQLAKDLGFASVDEMKVGLAKLKAQPAKEEEPEAQHSQGDAAAVTAEVPKLKKELARAEAEKSKMAKQLAEATRKAKHFERLANQAEAKGQLREAAIVAGVADVDFGVHLLQQAIAGKSPEEVTKFSEKAFFADLRKVKPYLFQEQEVAANTGTGTDAPPAAKTNGGGGKGFNALTASKADVDARLAKIGVRSRS